MYLGGCQCGSVRYQLSGEPLTCYACHCRDCQSESGSAFTVSMIVNRNDVKVIAGEVLENIYRLNDNELHRYHCSNCGSALWFSGAKIPEIVALKPGTLDDTSWFKPIAHVWVRSAQPWVLFDSNTPKYEQQPDISELIELWKISKKTESSA